MIKKNVIILTLSIFITSCASEETSNQNLTGTWISKSIGETFQNNTNLYLGTTIRYTTYYIEESSTDIQISSCERFNHPLFQPFQLTKNNDILDFININDTSFLITNEITLNRSYEITSSTDKTSYQETPTKVSSSIDLSRGSLQLNGPISGSNQNHVCLNQAAGSDPGQGGKYKITIPYDDDVIQLNINISQPLLTGNYQYDFNEAGNSPTLYAFLIESNSNTFWNTLSTNGLFPDLANLTITSSQAETIEGNFSFVGQDSGNYSGTFKFNPYYDTL